MAKYIDVLLTADGTFCIAPPWVVNAGDYIPVENVLTGETEFKRVIAKATDEEGGDFINMVEAYIRGKPQRVTTKYTEHSFDWRDDDVSE